MTLYFSIEPSPNHQKAVSFSEDFTLANLKVSNPLYRENNDVRTYDFSEIQTVIETPKRKKSTNMREGRIGLPTSACPAKYRARSATIFCVDPVNKEQLMRVARIELASPTWKAGILPLNYTRIIYILMNALCINGISKNIVAKLLVFREKTLILPLNYSRDT